MTLKKQHQLRSLDKTEVDQANQNFDELYRSKMEGRVHQDGSTTTIEAFQFTETGRIDVDANGSPTVTITVPIKNTYTTILYTDANTDESRLDARVTDITGTSITIVTRLGNVATNTLISNVITSTFSVRWILLGSSP